MHITITTRALSLLVLFLSIGPQLPVGAQHSEEPTSVRGTVVVPEDEPVATAVALMLRAHPTPSDTGAAGSLTELRSGIFVGPFVPVDDDGRFVLTLPAADTLPGALIGPAHRAVTNTGDFDGCELLTSDPLAQATFTGFAFVTSPGIALTTEIGTLVGVATDIPFDMISGDVDYEDVAFQVWMFADRDVHLTTPADGCSDDAGTLHVDVDLRRGWNQLAWRADVDAETGRVRGMTLSKSSAEEVFVVGVFEF
jgi:hypothetical protein